MSKGNPSTAKSATPPSKIKEKRSGGKKADESDGEALSGFNTSEWDTGAPAYNPELINLKTKPDKVTVFRASKTIKRTRRKPQSSNASDGEETSIRSDSTQSSKSVALTAEALGPPDAVFGAVGKKPQKSKVIDVELSPQIQSGSSSRKLPPSIKELGSSSSISHTADKAELVGRMVAGMVRVFLSKRREEDVQINVRLVYGGKLAPPSPATSNASLSSSVSQRSSMSEMLSPASIRDGSSPAFEKENNVKNQLSPIAKK